MTIQEFQDEALACCQGQIVFDHLNIIPNNRTGAVAVGTINSSLGESYCERDLADRNAERHELPDIAGVALLNRLLGRHGNAAEGGAGAI